MLDNFRGSADGMAPILRALLPLLLQMTLPRPSGAKWCGNVGSGQRWCGGILPSCFPNGVAQAVGEPVKALDAAAAALHAPPIDIAFFDTRMPPDTASMMRAARRIAASFGNRTAARVRFHAILNKQAILLPRFQKRLPGFRLTPLDLPARGQCLYDGMRRLSHGPGPQYLYKPLLHYIMPTDVRRLVVLDTDVVMLRDVAELYDEFDRFGMALLAIAREQSQLYAPLTGANGGVQLLDLEKMRASAEYNGLLDKHATGKDGRRIGYLGDQTLYTYLLAERPDLLAWLPCEWNRQISAHFGFHNATVHECPRRCGILHANYNPFKCVAWAMHDNPSCSAWKAFSDALTEPLSSTHTCPKDQDRGARKYFKSALLRFFADCCTPDGVFDAHGSRTLAKAEKLKAHAAG
jgi:hypothetical protein